MRTTLDIDEDVLFAAKERAQKQRRTAGAVLSELARESLTGGRRERPEGTEPFHGFRPLPHRGPVVSNELINRLRDEEGV
jgi:hypothetical protein